VSSHRTPNLYALYVLCVSLLSATAADNDWLPESARVAPGKGLNELDQRHAEAIAHYTTGLLLGASEGFAVFEKSLAADPANADLALRLANAYARMGNIPRALETLQRSVEALPNDSTLLLSMANIYYSYLGDVNTALSLAARAETLAPDDFAAADLALRIYRATNRDAEIRALLARLEKSESTKPNFWVELAWAKLDIDTPKERVLPLVIRAEKLAKESPETLVRIGALYGRLGHLAEATRAYEAAYNLQPNIDGLRENLVACYMDAERDSDAVPLLKEIITLNPLDINAYESLTVIHGRLGQPDEAVSASRQALLLDSKNIGRHVAHAASLLSAKQLDAAEKFLTEARAEFPDAPIFTYFLGMVFAGKERYDESLKLFAEAESAGIRMLPPEMVSEFYFTYGAVAEAAKRYDDAVVLLKRAIEMECGRSTDARNHLAYMWAERGEYLDEAETLIRRALEDQPTNAAFLDTLGWIQYKQGKYKSALETLRKALKHLDKPDAVIFDHIGDTCHKLGQRKRALEYWKKSLELDPTSETVEKKVQEATR